MPVYEYGCLKCGEKHEILQKFNDAPMAVCPDCGGEVKKLISNTSFVLKGTGWYMTDYADKKSPDKGKLSLKPDETKAEEKKPDAAAEAPADTKAEPKKEEVTAK